MCTVKKSIYGLVQAAWAWWKNFTKSLENIGFEKSANNNCFMVRQNTYGTVFLCIYVDDVCCIRDQNAISNAINKIKKIYTIKQVGEFTEFIRVNIKNTNEGIFFHKETL